MAETIEVPLQYTPEQKKQLIDGIKSRLSSWQVSKVDKLYSHLRLLSARGYTQKSVKDSWSEMIELCEEGTKEGRTRGTWHVAMNPDVAPKHTIDDLPWVVNHDDVRAEEILTVEDLMGCVKEVTR